jgi:hypothetical protein
MKKVEFVTRKVFDSCDILGAIPRDLEDDAGEFLSQDSELSNGSFISWTVGNQDYYHEGAEENYDEKDIRSAKEIDKVLIASGCKDQEEVVIHFWW